MSKTPWIILLGLWIIGATGWHVCRIKQVCPELLTGLMGGRAGDASASLVMDDPGRFRLVLPGRVRFARSGAAANLTGLRGPLDSLRTYLRNHPDRTLVVTGYYTPAETNPTPFADLGLARAEHFRTYLIGRGIPAGSLRTKSERWSNLTFTPKGDSLTGGLEFTFAHRLPVGNLPFNSGVGEAASESLVGAQSDKATARAASAEPFTVAEDATEQDLAAAETYTSVFEPINLYFSIGGANYIKTPETKRFFDEAARYLASHPTSKLIITGYTDDKGPENVNLRLSRERANSVRVKLRLWHIPDEQLVVEAKGEADPRAPNDTRAGRRANRRVTIVVQ